LSDVCSEIVLNCHSDQLLSTDIEIVIQNMVRSSLLGFASTIRSVDDDGPAGLPSRLDPSIDNTSTSSNCIYAHALQKLMTLRKRFELPISGVFLFEKVLILHAWAVYRGDLVHAEALGEMLQSHLCPRIPNYADVRIDILTQKCFYLARCKRWNQAKELLTMLIDQCKTEQRRLLHSRLLLQMAMLQLESCPRQFANALQPLLECLSAAYNFELDGVHATALTILAQVHLRMGKTKRALAVVRAALPTVAQNEHVWFQAEAYLTISKCYLQLAKRDGSIRVEMVHSAIANLHQSKDVFSRCQDCLRLKEVYFLLARSYDILPDHTSERDDASENFVLLSHHLIETNCPRKDDFLSSLDDGEKLNDIASRTIPVFVRSN
jgi:tetratricopeptide (TPR) repeat protein